MLIAHKLVRNNWQTAEGHEKERREIESLLSYGRYIYFAASEVPVLRPGFSYHKSQQTIKLLSYYDTHTNACN
jgi:hypothetical protein